MTDLLNPEIETSTETKIASEIESTEPIRPIWLREQYSTVDADLELMDNRIIIPVKEESIVVKKHFDLRSHYEPIWSYSKVGLILGLVIGIIFINIRYNTDALFPGILSIFIPSIIPSFLLVNLIGACLGCLLGMSVGGLIGWGRREFFPRAYDAVPESNNIIITVVLIPFLVVLGMLYAYLALKFLMVFFVAFILVKAMMVF